MCIINCNKSQREAILKKFFQSGVKVISIRPDLEDDMYHLTLRSSWFIKSHWQFRPYPYFSTAESEVGLCFGSVHFNGHRYDINVCAHTEPLLKHANNVAKKAIDKFEQGKGVIFKNTTHFVSASDTLPVMSLGAIIIGLVFFIVSTL